MIRSALSLLVFTLQSLGNETLAISRCPRIHRVYVLERALLCVLRGVRKFASLLVRPGQ
jgi:hypothetical protein